MIRNTCIIAAAVSKMAFFLLIAAGMTAVGLIPAAAAGSEALAAFVVVAGGALGLVLCAIPAIDAYYDIEWRA